MPDSRTHTHKVRHTKMSENEPNAKLMPHIIIIFFFHSSFIHQLRNAAHAEHAEHRKIIIMENCYPKHKMLNYCYIIIIIIIRTERRKIMCFVEWNGMSGSGRRWPYGACRQQQIDVSIGHKLLLSWNVIPALSNSSLSSLSLSSLSSSSSPIFLPVEWLMLIALYLLDGDKKQHFFFARCHRCIAR